MKVRIKTYAVLVLVTACLCVLHGCSRSSSKDEGGSGSEAKPKAESGPMGQIKEIFALAKKSVERNHNINVCGFFTGMSRHDATALAAHYKLHDGDYSIEARPGKAVSRIWISLQGVRSITKGGNTLDELAGAVMIRVGNLKKCGDAKWEYKTIDGIALSMTDKGLEIQNDRVASRKPIATKAAEWEDWADEMGIVEYRETAIKNAKEAAQNILKDMVAIPDKGFKMGRYEVTQKLWVGIMGNNPSRFKGNDNPVEQVSWSDCQKFLERLNAMPDVKRVKLTFRLPTETEWEYACRAGGTGEYCRLVDGAEITKETLDKVAWYKDNSGDLTHPVGQKKPNAFGLYDMHGNVWEWCEDLYQAGRLNRVNRGGGWINDSSGCSSGSRYYGGPDNRYGRLGFRLVASQD